MCVGIGAYTDLNVKPDGYARLKMEIFRRVLCAAIPIKVMVSVATVVEVEKADSSLLPDVETAAEVECGAFEGGGNH